MAHGQLHSVLRYIRRIAGSHGDGLTDGQLLERFRTERDEAAFEVLVWRHGPMVFGLCRRLLQNVQAAEDALQATFLTLVRKADSVNQRNSIGSWLYKVAYRIALRARAEAVKRAAHEKQVPELPPIQAPGETGGMIAAWELRALLDEELNRLPERCRVPVVLCWLEGKTHEEAARELGWAKGTVATRLLRARELLRRRLVSRGLTLSAGAFATVLAEQTTSAAVPAVLVAATRKAALAFAAGETAGAVSSQVIAFTEGALRTMSITKLKSVTAVALIVGMLGTGAGVAYYRSLFGAPPEASSDQPARGGAEEKMSDSGPARWQQRVTVRGHIGSTDTAFSPDSKRLATIGMDCVMKFWDTSNWQELASFNVGQRYSTCTIIPFWSPDNKTVAVFGGNKGKDGRRVPEVTLLDSGTGKPVRTFPGYNPHFSPDGKIVATRLGDIVKLWDYRTGTERATLQAGAAIVGILQDAIFSPHGETVATAAADCTVKLWDVASGKERARLPGYSPTFSPDGKFLATALLERSIKLWEVATGKEHATLGGHTFPYIALAFSPDSKLLASWGTHFGIAAGGQHPDPNLGGLPKRPSELKLWSVATGKEIIVLPGQALGESWATFSPDGKTLAYGRVPDRGKQRYVVLWDLVLGKERATIQSGVDHVRRAEFTPDGQWLWTDSMDGAVQLWDPTTGRQVAILRGTKNTLFGAVFSRDGRMVAMMDYDASDPDWFQHAVTEVTIWQLSKQPLTKEARGTPAQKKQPPPEAIKAADPEKKPATPAEEYQALLQEYGNALSEYGKAYSDAKTDAERQTLEKEKLPKPDPYAVRALALAQKYPKDPAAVDALSFVVQLSLGPGAEAAKRKVLAFDLLLRNHLQSDKLQTALSLLTHLPTQASEDFLRAAFEKSPSRSMQGHACYNLACYLQTEAETLRLLKQQPELAKQAEKNWGADLLKELQEKDATQLTKEAEHLYERVQKQYRDVQNGSGTLGEAAESALFALRHLAIGNPAPEIEGEDIDGKPLRLSDYRGKVVVLDFWGHW